MDLKIAVAIIAGIVTAVGWLTNHVLSERAQRRRQRLQSQLEYATQQLEELYGPLAVHIIEGKRVYTDLLETLGRESVFRNSNPLPTEDLDAWMFWLEHSLLPRNRAIRNLLSTKIHLIEGSLMPSSYVTFLQHISSWEVKHSRWKEEGVEYGWQPSVDWPENFSAEILETFELIKARHAQLVSQL